MINYNNIRLGMRAAVWTRVSTKYQEDNGGSLASQKEICERFAKERGYSVVKYFGGSHESAKTPGNMIKTMVESVKRDQSISTIIISEFDRFSRELWQATKMIEDLRRLGVIVIAAKFGMDTRTKEGMLMAQQTLSMAQWDNQNRTDKFVGGRADCMKAGAWIEKAPLGYYKEGKSRDTYCYLNEKGRLLSQAFKWKLTGVTNSEIITMLAARGFLITKQGLHRVFVNPFYAGKIQTKYTNMEMIDGRIEPAVTYADFLRVQEILSGRTGVYAVKREDEIHPLKGHVICAVDGTPFTGYTAKKKLKTKIQKKDYYKCNKTGCRTNVSAAEMHAKYEALLTNYELDESTVMVFEGILRDIFAEHAKKSVVESSTLKRHLSEIDRDIKNVKMRYATGKIDEDTFSTAIQEYNNRRDVVLLELEKWSTNLSNQEKQIPVIIATASQLATLWKTSDLKTKRRIQNLVFPEGIFWDKEKRNYRTKKTNAIFEIMSRLSITYGQKKRTASEEAVPLCG